MSACWKRLAGISLLLCGAVRPHAGSNAAAPTPPGDAPATSFRFPAGYTIDIAVREGLLTAPVAIDWAADGRLWVAEVDAAGSNPPGAGGSVKLLADTDADGQYDQAATFLGGLPNPAGLMAWGRGVVVCAAPDLLYAQDTTGDGQADVARRLWVGFDAANPVLRFNSLSLGLDNWIHAAGGSRGGEIRRMARLDPGPPPPSTDVIHLGRQDFRFRPDAGELEAVSGSTAFGRVRDHRGSWFGCDADGLVWQYPLPRRYRDRNPHVPLPDDAALLFRPPGPPGPMPRLTSFCLARGGLAPADDTDSAFLCEPEAKRVSRLALSLSGITYTVPDAPTPFLTSLDPGFEPIQVRLGLDGALWIVDRHGAPAVPGNHGGATGRILRLRPKQTQAGSIHDLTRLPIAGLVKALDTPRGAERDRVHAQLLHRGDPDAGAALRQLARGSRWPAARAQALCVLDGLGLLTAQDLESALEDPHPDVRVQAIRLCEPWLRGADAVPGFALAAALLQRVADPEWTVRYQLVLTLGEWDDARAGEALGRLAAAGLQDPWLRAAALTSAASFPDEILQSVLLLDPVSPTLAGFVDALALTVAKGRNDAALDRFVGLLNLQVTGVREGLALEAFARLLEALEDCPAPANPGGALSDARVDRAAVRGAALAQRARILARDAQAGEGIRLSAARLLGQLPGVTAADLEYLSRWLIAADTIRQKEAVLSSLVATRHSSVADLLLRGWSHQPPSVRQAIVGPLLTRPDWAGRLLDAVAKSVVATTEVTPVNRERLGNHAEAQVRARAREVFAARLPERRAQVVARWAPALTLTGEAARGRATFENLCSRCHAAGRLGASVGPELAALGSRTAAELLESLLDPSAIIEPRFVAYQVETEDERSLSGIVTAESGTDLTLVQPGGQPATVALKAMTDLRASNLSLMPEGLEEGLTPQDVADLLAFIRSLAPPPSS